MATFQSIQHGTKPWLGYHVIEQCCVLLCLLPFFSLEKMSLVVKIHLLIKGKNNLEKTTDKDSGGLNLHCRHAIPKDMSE